MRWRTNWERSITGDKKPYWYVDCLDVDGRPLWMARVEPFGKTKYVLRLRIAGYNFDDFSYYDSINDAKKAFEHYIADTAEGMLKQVGRVRK